jgi:hypothetical protein
MGGCARTALTTGARADRGDSGSTADVSGVGNGGRTPPLLLLLLLLLSRGPPKL